MLKHLEKNIRDFLIWWNNFISNIKLINWSNLLAYILVEITKEKFNKKKKKKKKKKTGENKIISIINNT